MTGGAPVHGTNITWEHLHCLAARGSISSGGPVNVSLAGGRCAIATRATGALVHCECDEMVIVKYFEREPRRVVCRHHAGHEGILHEVT